ncbi:hypothetical protein GCM10019016_111170 [Streptomyces prasinosporus]|uniref:Uncharacterized protein n=1 Tax=Streptomyces prasinosporus TaxID=68256 RepID=A0ABP6UBT9_9ACTN
MNGAAPRVPPRRRGPAGPAEAPYIRHKGRKCRATPDGDCGRPSASRMVTLIYPRLPVVHP